MAFLEDSILPSPGVFPQAGGNAHALMKYGNNPNMFRGELPKEDQMVAIAKIEDTGQLFISNRTP